jgi:hypothetical protein
MRTAETMLLAGLLCAGCPSGPPPPPPGPVPQGKPFTTGTAEPPAQPADGATRVFSLGMPATNWVVRFEWPDGVRVTSDRLEQGGTIRRLMSVGDNGRLTLSLLIAPAPAGVTTATQLRDLEWNRLRLANRFVMQELQTFETTGVSGGHYRVPVLRGLPENRHDHHCWLLHDGVAIHAWITKSHAGPNDLARFDAWAKTLRVAAEPAPAGDRLLFGRALLGDGAPNAAERALPHFEAAGKGWSALDPAQRLRWVEAASNAYLALDRPDAALRTCERLLQSPAVPALAHYCRARALSALERNEEALAALERAFAVEGAYARLPDPSEDDWFILLGDDPKFEALVKRRAAQIAADEKK